MKYILVTLLFVFNLSIGQTPQQDSKDISVSPFIDGTILVPKNIEKPPLAIIIGGSGPTDRNGNQQMMENNSLRYLAEGLYKNNIATFRYDKRIVKQMKDRTVNEASIRFDDFIEDAVAVVNYFKRSNSFSQIYIIGHSQGSLVGMVAAQEGVDGFISIAGAGQPIDKVIIDQLGNQAPEMKDNAILAFNDMRKNKTTDKYSPLLASIFRPSLQPFMYSWMKYDPALELAKLTTPVMIINGDNDMQVAVTEAEILKSVKPTETFYIVPKMNHILKQIDGDMMENQKSYNDYKQPVMPALIESITGFIQS